MESLARMMAPDSGGHLLGALHAETHVSVVVSNSYESLEPSSLTSSGLLLDGHDLENLVLQSGTDEHVNDLVLFDGERVEIYLLQALDLPILHQTAQLGNGNPVLLLLASASSASTATTSASSATASPATISKSSTESTTVTSWGWSTVRHNVLSVLSREPEERLLQCGE